RFGVEALHAGQQRIANFPGLLAHPGEHDLGRIAAGGQHALEFAARDDIEARPQPGELFQHSQVGIGLHAITDQHRTAADGVAVGLAGLAQRGARIHIKRRAQLRGQRVERHAFGMQYAVLVMKMRIAGQDRPRGTVGCHGSVAGAGIWGGGGVVGPVWPDSGGRYSGPLKPHAAARLVAASGATRRKTMRPCAKWNTRNSVILAGSIMTETEFLALVDQVLDSIESQADDWAAGQDVDIEASRSGNVLTLVFEDGTHVVVNAQTAMQE